MKSDRSVVTAATGMLAILVVTFRHYVIVKESESLKTVETVHKNLIAVAKL